MLIADNGCDGPRIQKAAQVVGQGLGTGIAPLGPLLQAGQADCFQLARHIGSEARKRRRLVVQYLPDGLVPRFIDKRRPARDELVENGPERINVRGRANRAEAPLGLLGGHV